jgi:hypothetical protein
MMHHGIALHAGSFNGEAVADHGTVRAHTAVEGHVTAKRRLIVLNVVGLARCFIGAETPNTARLAERGGLRTLATGIPP